MQMQLQMQILICIYSRKNLEEPVLCYVTIYIGNTLFASDVLICLVNPWDIWTTCKTNKSFSKI